MFIQMSLPHSPKCQDNKPPYPLRQIRGSNNSSRIASCASCFACWRSSFSCAGFGLLSSSCCSRRHSFGVPGRKCDGLGSKTIHVHCDDLTHIVCECVSRYVWQCFLANLGQFWRGCWQALLHWRRNCTSIDKHLGICREWRMNQEKQLYLWTLRSLQYRRPWKPGLNLDRYCICWTSEIDRQGGIGWVSKCLRWKRLWPSAAHAVLCLCTSIYSGR